MLRILVLLIVCTACSKPRPSVAVLEKASGPVTRIAGGRGNAQNAVLGTKFYLRDIVRTQAGEAELTLRDGARVAMPPHSALQFVEGANMVGLEIEEGTITLSGTGTYNLEMGTLSLEQGSVRVGSKTVQLVLGRGELVRSGESVPLEPNKILSLELGQGTLAAVTVAVADAAVAADAGVVDAMPDAGVAAGVAIEVKGDGATMQRAGDARPSKVASGTSTLEPGTRITLDAKTTASIGVRGTTLELAPGSRAKVTAALELELEAGAASVRVAAGQSDHVRVPGGQVKPNATPTTGAETRIDIARGNATITAVTGGAQLIGKRGDPVELPPGESATVRANGSVAPGELVSPAYFDYELEAGKPSSLTIHDSTGTTAVRFGFISVCKDEGAVELDRNALFRSPLVAVGKRHANLMVRAGNWSYRVRCITDGTRGDAVVSGRITVVRDRGVRPLPKDPPHFEIATDGRNYRLDYQSRIPDVHIRSGGRGSVFKLRLASGTDERVLSSSTGSFSIPGHSLREREYTFWVERDGVKSKVSTLRIGFDQTAAQVYIEAPTDGRPWGPHVEVEGATLPGWSATIDGKAVASDKNTRRFSTIVPAPKEARAIAIQLAHPERGVHVYIRRGAPR
jgi:hypothetical protein